MPSSRRLARLLPVLALTAAGCGNDVGEVSSHEALVDAATSASDASVHGGADANVDPGNVLMNHGGTHRDAEVNNTCESLTINAAPNPPEVLIVLDRSGSMIGNNPTSTNRWTPSSKVIKTLTSQLDQVMQFGLMVFPATGGSSLISCDVGKLDVPIALGSSSKIAQKIDGSQPTWTSATPTAATLTAARTAIGGGTVCADCVAASKYVLLVTDGAPNCAGGYQIDSTSSDVAACNSGIDALKTDGVTTYVIGYDTAKDTSVAKIMDGFAMHGGTGKQLPVEDEKSLLSTLTTIAGQLVACDYKLASEVTNPSFVRVTIDGEQYNYGTGWTLKDDKRTVVLGSACGKLRDLQPHNLHITLECSQVIPI